MVYYSGKKHYVHRLVAELFIGEIPKGMQINHKNFDRADNRVENLEIVTQGDNTRHSSAAGRTGGLNRVAVTVNYCDGSSESFCSMTEAAKKLGVRLKEVWQYKCGTLSSSKLEEFRSLGVLSIEEGG